MKVSDILEIANSIAPCVRTRHAIECNNCGGVIAVTHVYFTNLGEPDNDCPWCQQCGLKLLLNMHVIDVDTLIAFPVYGPLPEWILDHTPLHWVAPMLHQR